jgi:hypothetical protein
MSEVIWLYREKSRRNIELRGIFTDGNMRNGVDEAKVGLRD